jgi:hypothetical protein
MCVHYSQYSTCQKPENGVLLINVSLMKKSTLHRFLYKKNGKLFRNVKYKSAMINKHRQLLRYEKRD